MPGFAGQVEGLGDGVEYLAGDILGMQRRIGGQQAEVFEHDDELVATGPGDEVLGAQVADQLSRQFDEQQVALIVAARVVEGAEVVEVDDQQRAIDEFLRQV